jgi:hypothetical protein
MFNTATTDWTKANHFLNHLDNEHAQEEVRCQFPGCAIDIGGFDESGFMRHLRSHYTSNSTRTKQIEPLKSHEVYPHKGCGETFQGKTQEEIHGHLETHVKGKLRNGRRGRISIEDASGQAAYVPTSPSVSSVDLAGPSAPKTGSTGGVDPNEDQKNIPDRLKKANPGKNFYCPICYKLLGKQSSPCNVRILSTLSRSC